MQLATLRGGRCEFSSECKPEGLQPGTQEADAVSSSIFPSYARRSRMIRLFFFWQWRPLTPFCLLRRRHDRQLLTSLLVLAHRLSSLSIAPSPPSSRHGLNQGTRNRNSLLEMLSHAKSEEMDAKSLSYETRRAGYQGYRRKE